MGNVVEIVTFSEFNLSTAKSLSVIIETGNTEIGLCNIDKYKEAFNKCVNNIKVYATKNRSAFIVALIEYYKTQRYFYAIDGINKLFSRRAFDIAEYLSHYNEINNFISCTKWNNDCELYNDLLNFYNTDIIGSNKETSDNKTNKVARSFEDLIECDNKDQLIDNLKTLFANAKGKQAATILLALKQKDYIYLPVRGKGDIYDAINECFGLSLTNQHYQRYIQFDNDNLKQIIPQKEIDQIKAKI